MKNAEIRPDADYNDDFILCRGSYGHIHINRGVLGGRPLCGDCMCIQYRGESVLPSLPHAGTPENEDK